MTDERCPVCGSCPLVLIAIAHPAMRRMIVELLDREHGCWHACVLGGPLQPVLGVPSPDLIIVDGVDFPRSCRELLPGYPANRIVVIGPEPDAAYRAAALCSGAGGWVARDDIADQLSATMRVALGCRHGPCPKP